MVTPFIRNHQYNLIKKQAGLLRHARNTISDLNVLESVSYSVQSKIIEAFPNATEPHKQMLEQISTLYTAEEFQHYLHSLEPYLEAFPQLTGKQLNKLFPKIKKLKLPELNAIDYRHVTYLGWTDTAASKMFLVYDRDGHFIGVEGRYTPANKGVCFLCNRLEEVAFFSATCKKPAGAPPDYYRAIGNYICVDSDICNKNITDVTALENFVQEVAGPARGF